jgi:hypothetical protein
VPPHNNVKRKPEESLIPLLSKRRHSFHGGSVLTWLEIDSNERKNLYEIAKQRGLLTEYRFSGIKAYGVSRNDAVRWLMEKTRNRALEKLRAEFGSMAHFWVQPRRLSYVDIDFYWRSAKLGIVITGPLKDDPYRGDSVRAKEPAPSSKDAAISAMRIGVEDITIFTVPYYQVWHRPSVFLEQIRSKLILSGHYPKLSAVDRTA